MGRLGSHASLGSDTVLQCHKCSKCKIASPWTGRPVDDYCVAQGQVSHLPKLPNNWLRLVLKRLCVVM